MFGIDCSDRYVDLSTAAKAQKAPVEAVIAALDEAIPPETSSRIICDWTSVSSVQIVDYILDRHHTFMKRQMPKIEQLLDQAIEQPQPDQLPQSLRSLKTVFDRFATDIDAHIIMEEQTLFPWVRQSWRLRQDGRKPSPTPWTSWQEHPLYQMEYEHERVREALSSMSELTDDYALPRGANRVVEQLYSALAELDADLREHIRLENDYLWPVRPRRPHAH